MKKWLVLKDDGSSTAPLSAEELREGLRMGAFSIESLVIDQMTNRKMKVMECDEIFSNVSLPSQEISSVQQKNSFFTEVNTKVLNANKTKSRQHRSFKESLRKYHIARQRRESTQNLASIGGKSIKLGAYAGALAVFLCLGLYTAHYFKIDVKMIKQAIAKATTKEPVKIDYRPPSLEGRASDKDGINEAPPKLLSSIAEARAYNGKIFKLGPLVYASSQLHACPEKCKLTVKDTGGREIVLKLIKSSFASSLKAAGKHIYVTGSLSKSGKFLYPAKISGK